MSNEILQLYISEQLIGFNAASRCCMKFLGQLFTIEPMFFARVVNDLGLRMRPYVLNGQESVLVYKDSCHHVLMDVMDLKLCPRSVKDMYMLHCGSDFSGSQKEFQMSPEFLSPGNSIPVVPPHRFSLGPLKQSLARSHPTGHRSFQMFCPMQCHKEKILQALKRNRVLVINVGSTLDKSTAIPMYIIEKCSEERRHCKIICVEREELVVTYNSECLAGHFHEKIGETVAYQVQLQSRISESSNLVYTTSSFLLRVLMGQSIVDSFRHISHVVVVDAHLHEAFADLLLRELKHALRFHPYLKIVLLSNCSNNSEFLQYFGEGEELRLNDKQASNVKTEVLYVEDIRKALSEDRPSKMMAKAFHAHAISHSSLAQINAKHLDACLEIYERTSSENAFEKILYMIQVECADINHRHCVTGRTALIISAILGKCHHVRTLLQLDADPFITDKLDVDALKAAISADNAECVDILKTACFDKTPKNKDWKKNYIDHRMITDIIHMVLTSDQWKMGNIIVCLPSYQHLIQLNYIILKEQLLGNLPEQILIYLLHNQTEKPQLDVIMNTDQKKVKIILSTDIAETLMCFEDILYVIDAARSYRCVYNTENQSKENTYEWSSKTSLENRKLLLNKNGGGICFRLLPEERYEQLPEVLTADVLCMPLDRVCLAIKLLSHQTMVSEYFQETIIKPPFAHVFQCVENLKKIGVFTELEDITWLGCRLIDVPVECQLGRLLVFAILLQCLDPVLTIVSFMSTLDPFEISQYLDDLTEPYKETIRSKLKGERNRFAEGRQSDHLMLLRLYQEWQNDLKNQGGDSVPIKYTFMLNGLLEYVCNARTQLVGALRSSQLVHNKGNLSMHYINLKSNCWPIIKAALVGGLYPSICVLDRKVNRLKSPFKRELVLHPDSVLRDLDLDSLKKMDFTSSWVIYGSTSKGRECTSINYNTIVAAITVALFAGPSKISFVNSHITSVANSDNTQCYFHIDEWISFKVDHTTAQLLFKTRQYFHSIYVNYLQHCGLMDKFKRPQCSLAQNALLFDYIEKILVQEDVAIGFEQPERIGMRPKAVPNKLMMTLDGSMLLSTCMYRTHMRTMASGGPRDHQILTRAVTKQYYMVYKQDADDINNNPMNMNSQRSSEWYHTLMTLLDSKSAASPLIFIIFYSRNPDYLRSVSIAEWYNGYLELHPCFKHNIDLCNVLNNPAISDNTLLSLGISQRRLVFAIDRLSGTFIVNMFAYRSNWLHNN